MLFPNDSRIPSRVALSCNFNHSLLFCEPEKTLQLLKTLDGTTHLVLKPHETLWDGVIFTNGASPSFHGSRWSHANLEWNSLSLPRYSSPLSSIFIVPCIITSLIGL